MKNNINIPACFALAMTVAVIILNFLEFFKSHSEGSITVTIILYLILVFWGVYEEEKRS